MLTTSLEKSELIRSPPVIALLLTATPLDQLTKLEQLNFRGKLFF